MFRARPVGAYPKPGRHRFAARLPSARRQGTVCSACLLPAAVSDSEHGEPGRQAGRRGAQREPRGHRTAHSHSGLQAFYTPAHKLPPCRPCVSRPPPSRRPATACASRALARTCTDLNLCICPGPSFCACRAFGAEGQMLLCRHASPATAPLPQLSVFRRPAAWATLISPPGEYLIILHFLASLIKTYHVFVMTYTTPSLDIFQYSTCPAPSPDKGGVSFIHGFVRPVSHGYP